MKDRFLLKGPHAITFWRIQLWGSLKVTRVFHSIVGIKLVQECVLPLLEPHALHREIWSHVQTNDRTHLPQGWVAHIMRLNGVSSVARKQHPLGFWEEERRLAQDFVVVIGGAGEQSEVPTCGQGLAEFEVPADAAGENTELSHQLAQMWTEGQRESEAEKLSEAKHQKLESNSVMLSGNTDIVAWGVHSHWSDWRGCMIHGLALKPGSWLWTWGAPAQAPQGPTVDKRRCNEAVTSTHISVNRCIFRWHFPAHQLCLLEQAASNPSSLDQ